MVARACGLFRGYCTRVVAQWAVKMTRAVDGEPFGISKLTEGYYGS